MSLFLMPAGVALTIAGWVLVGLSSVFYLCEMITQKKVKDSNPNSLIG